MKGRLKALSTAEDAVHKTDQHLPLLPVNLSSGRGHTHHTCSDSPGTAPGHQKQVPELGRATPEQPVPASETANSPICSVCTGMWLISTQRYHAWSSPSPSRCLRREGKAVRGAQTLHPTRLPRHLGVKPSFSACPVSRGVTWALLPLVVAPTFPQPLLLC